MNWNHQYELKVSYLHKSLCFCVDVYTLSSWNQWKCLERITIPVRGPSPACFMVCNIILH